MDKVNEEVERLIVRALDGQADEDEQLRLNRELLRNPDARRLMNEYKRVDELAVEALRSAGLCGASQDGRATSVNEMNLPDRAEPDWRTDAAGSGAIRRFHRERWLLAGSAIAAVLAIAVARFPGVGPASRTRDTTAIVDSKLQPVRAFTGPSRPAESLVRNVAYDPRDVRIRRDMGRDVFGVIGEDGSIYWIEVDRIRTIRMPKHPWWTDAPPGEL